jgi:hypothetical protein
MLEYTIGALEALSFILMSLLPSLSPVPILLLLSFKSISSHKPWELPPSLLSSSSLTKVLFGAILRFLTVALTVCLAAESPVL